MKMTPEHYNRLKSAIDTALTDHSTFVSGSKALNHTPMQMRWDIFHLVGSIDNYALARELWAYLNDDNIDTALRKITGII